MRSTVSINLSSSIEKSFSGKYMAKISTMSLVSTERSLFFAPSPCVPNIRIGNRPTSAASVFGGRKFVSDNLRGMFLKIRGVAW